MPSSYAIVDGSDQQIGWVHATSINNWSFQWIIAIEPEMGCWCWQSCGASAGGEYVLVQLNLGTILCADAAAS